MSSTEALQVLASTIIFSREGDVQALTRVVDEKIAELHEQGLCAEVFLRSAFLHSAVRLDRALPAEKIDELRVWLVHSAVKVDKEGQG
jgi:hypothetical protein